MRNRYIFFNFFSIFILFICSCSALRATQMTASNVSVTASSEFYPPYTAATLTIDGSGLTGDLHDNHAQGHTMWLSKSEGGGGASNNPGGISGKAWLLYQFAQPMELSSAWIWNHNQLNLTDRGLRQISIHYSADGSKWTLLMNKELTRAPGTPNYAHGDEIDFNGITAKYILITAAETNGNYGSDYYGLSEIRFYGDIPSCFPDDYPVRLISVTIDPVYDKMLYPQPSGWIGSDVAHSTPLSQSKNLWLFGDTFIGTVSNGKRNTGAKFINNSIAIQDLDSSPTTNVKYYWGQNDTSFFPHQAGTPGNIYWPTMSVMIKGELFIFCYSVASGFTLENTTMIRVSNPLESPDKWNVRYFDLGIDNGIIGVHSAMIVEEPYLYMMGYYNNQYMVLARALTQDLLNGGLSEVFEYWVSSGNIKTWSKTSQNLVPLFSPSNTETDIYYEPKWDRYFAMAYNPFQPTIYLTTAKSLTGPWSQPVCIYDVPEFEAVSFDIIAYAVRPHPELSTKPGEMIISYATNALGGLEPLFTEEGLGIYYPRFIRIQLELNTKNSEYFALY